MKLRAATRSSPLALCQTQIVAAELQKSFGELEVEPVVIQTEGDIKIEAPISEIGGKAVFAVALEKALLAGEADIAVHSAKDLSARFPEELSIGAVLERADARDILVGVDAIEKLPKRAVVGTGSARRKIQLKDIRPDLEFREIRGNIGTRLERLETTEEFDAVLVAKAALDRLKLELTQEFCILETNLMIPQVGQGFLAVQYVKEQTEVGEFLAGINDATSYNLLEAERGFLRELDGDCNIPAAAYAQYTESYPNENSQTIQIQGMLARNEEEEGGEMHRLMLEGLMSESFDGGAGQIPSELGSSLARGLLEMSSSK